MALYHDPKTGTTVEAKNAKEAMKPKKVEAPKKEAPKKTTKKES